MFEEVSIDVAAPPDAVWASVSDVESWPKLTASVTHVEPLDGLVSGIGSRARVVQPRLRPATWTVTRWEPGHGFSWESKAAGMTTVGDHYVEATAGGSRLTLRIHQHGLLAPVVGLFYRKLTRRYMEMEATGMKRAAEEAAATVA